MYENVMLRKVRIECECDDRSAEEKTKEKISDLTGKLVTEKKRLKVINRLKELGIDIEVLKEVLKL